VVIALPARAKKSDRDRAIANFASGMLLWGLIALELLYALVDGALDGNFGYPFTTEQTLMLVATVLFTFSGAFYWIMSRNEAGT
jgi:hypothetical protein